MSLDQRDDDEYYSDDFNDDDFEGPSSRLGQSDNNDVSPLKMSSESLDKLQIFRQLVQYRQEDNTLGRADADIDIIEEAKRLHIEDDATIVLAEVVFEGDITQNISKYRVLLKRLTKNSFTAQRNLIGGLELKIHDDKSLLSKVDEIIKQLFNNGILTSETLLDWVEEDSTEFVDLSTNRAVRVNADKFITTLENSNDSDSSSVSN